jgi:hypothetical protein
MSKKPHQVVSGQLAELPPPINAKRFHPEGPRLFCRLKPEKMIGRLHVPTNVHVGIPVAEILEVGPEVKAKEKFRAGVHVLVVLRDTMQIDGELLFVEESKVLATVDPKSVIEQPGLVTAS